MINFPNNMVQFGGPAAFPGAVLPVASFASQTTIVAGVAAPDNYQAFAKWGVQTVTGIYQVPSGKTFFAAGFYAHTSTAGQFSLRFGYGTATFTDNQAGAPTGVVAYAPTNANDANLALNTTATWYAIPIKFPADSFPFVVAATGGVMFYIPGHEL